MRPLVIVGASGLRGRAVLDLATDVIPCLARDPRFTHRRARVLRGELEHLPDGLFPEEEHVVLHFAVDPRAPRANVEGTRRLLAALDPSRTKGVIYASSASVYGSPPFERVSETASVVPTTDLARSRAESERLLLDWARATGRSAILLRTRFLVASGEREVAGALRKLARVPFVPGSGKQRFSVLSAEAFGRSALALVEQIHDAHEPLRGPLNLGWTGTPALAPLLDALAPRMRIPLRLGPLLRLAGLELAAFEQTLDVTRAVTCHGLSFLERSPGEATAEIAAILRGAA